MGEILSQFFSTKFFIHPNDFYDRSWSLGMVNLFKADTNEAELVFPGIELSCKSLGPRESDKKVKVVPILSNFFS